MSLIILARKIVPNYWEIKVVDGAYFGPVDEWTAIAHSRDMSFNDIKRAYSPVDTLIDVSAHFNLPSGLQNIF